MGSEPIETMIVFLTFRGVILATQWYVARINLVNMRRKTTVNGDIRENVPVH